MFPQRGSWGGFAGEAAEEESGVGGPYEPDGDVGVAFIVDAKPAVIDEPGPGSLDEPAVREDLELVGFTAIDDLRGES
jgi:hypothetical protein